MTDYTDILPADARELHRDLSDTSGGPGSTPYRRVRLEITEDGRVNLSGRTYYGGDGTPVSEWHRRDLVYTVEPNADGETLRADLAEGGRIAVLIDRIKAGRSVEWDGSNMVGRLTEDASDADVDLREPLDVYPTYSGQVCTAEFWLIGDESPARVLVDGGDTAEDLLAQAESMSVDRHRWPRRDAGGAGSGAQGAGRGRRREHVRRARRAER